MKNDPLPVATDSPEPLVPRGRMKELHDQVNRAYRRFGARYGWKNTFNPHFEGEESDPESYNRERGLA